MEKEKHRSNMNISLMFLCLACQNRRRIIKKTSAGLFLRYVHCLALLTCKPLNVHALSILSAFLFGSFCWVHKSTQWNLSVFTIYSQPNTNNAVSDLFFFLFGPFLGIFFHSFLFVSFLFFLSGNLALGACTTRSTIRKSFDKFLLDIRVRIGLNKGRPKWHLEYFCKLYCHSVANPFILAKSVLSFFLIIFGEFDSLNFFHNSRCLIIHPAQYLQMFAERSILFLDCAGIHINTCAIFFSSFIRSSLLYTWLYSTQFSTFFFGFGLMYPRRNTHRNQWMYLTVAINIHVKTYVLLHFWLIHKMLFVRCTTHWLHIRWNAVFFHHTK